MNIIEEEVKKKKGAKYVNSGNYYLYLLYLSIYCQSNLFSLYMHTRYFTM